MPLKQTISTFFREPRNAMLAFLLITGSLLHLIGLNHPNSVVFDEVHFGGFAKKYCCTGEYFFDIHPPHGKLIIAGVAKLVGVDKGQSFEKIGTEYIDNTGVGLRLAPAIAGTLIPLAVFVLLQQLGASLAACFFGALLFLFDNALLLQTRIIALDGFLIFFMLTSLSAFLYAMKQTGFKQQMAAYALSGFLASLAVATKFTGLVAIGIPGLIGLLDLWEKRTMARFRYWLKAAAVYVFAGGFIYLLGWYLHFAILTEPGPGDAWGRPSGNFFADFIKLHGQMLSSNSGLTATHPDASPWWSWPIMMTPVLYWSKEQNWIYMVGNPIAWWVMSVVFFVAIINFIIRDISDLKVADDKEFSKRNLWIPFIGYCAAYLPIVAVSRVLFIYHYYSALMFSLIFAVLWLDAIGAIQDKPITQQRWSYYAFTALLIAGFVVISPVTFGVMGDVAMKGWIFKTFPGWR